MDELAVADVVATEQEAELLGGLLRSAGIKCIVRQTNFGAGASDGMPTGGPYEIVVRAEDLDAAREVLGRDNDPHRVRGDG
jgi:Putative prokaryotic signal transducing protein